MQLNNNSITKTAQVEILVPRNTVTNQLTFPFPDQPFLRGKKIHSIVLSPSIFSAQSGLLNLNAYLPLPGPFTFAPTNSFFLTLQDNKGNQVVQNLPLIELNPFNVNDNQGADFGVSKYNADGILALNPVEIVWTKSYISVPTAAFTTPSAFDRGFQFIVFFK